MKNQIESINKQIRELERKKLELECNHEWNEPKYDPEEVEEPNYELKWQGVDPYYAATTSYTKTVPRWSRVCKKCGKKEYAYEVETIAVKTITRPKF